MKICLCYVCVSNGNKTTDLAVRFVTTYHAFPPGVEHDTLILCNGGPLKTEHALLFSGMNAKMFPRQNDGGWDISAYIDAARGPCSQYDAMLCCGESIYFHRKGWLSRFVDAWERSGVGMYGSLSSNLVRGHLNTTGFLSSPSLIGGYPKTVNDKKSRYEFEHGQQALWRTIYRRGLPVRLVTWDGEYDPHQWRMPKNILWRGDQSNCLMWCQHVDRYREMDENTKRTWSRNADREFK